MSDKINERTLAMTNSASASNAPAFDRLGGRILLGAILVFGLVGGVGAWAFTANLTGAVIAMGTVKVDQNLNRNYS